MNSLHFRERTTVRISHAGGNGVVCRVGRVKRFSTGATSLARKPRNRRKEARKSEQRWYRERVVRPLIRANCAFFCIYRRSFASAVNSKNNRIDVFGNYAKNCSLALSVLIADFWQHSTTFKTTLTGLVFVVAAQMCGNMPS